MRLQFLGTGAGNFRSARRHMSSAYFEGLLLDCGAGATGRLHDAGLFDRVDGVLLSHLHTDHLAGLFDLLLHTVLTERTRPLTIVSPPGLAPILRAMFDAGATVVDPAERYDLRVVESSAPDLTIGPWTVRGVPLHHTVFNLGYEVRSDRGSLYYTGDTRVPTHPDGLRVDTVVHEATYGDRDEHLAAEFGHSTASQAARAAEALGARRLFLTHLGGKEGTEAEVGRAARAIFPDAVVAEDNARFEI
jgi:ribonuclease Z